MRKPYDLLFDKYHQRESHFKHIIDGNVNELKKQQFYEWRICFIKSLLISLSVFNYCV